jgi:hypothetical protein
VPAAEAAQVRYYQLSSDAAAHHLFSRMIVSCGSSAMPLLLCAGGKCTIVQGETAPNAPRKISPLQLAR